ncbi:MAG: helix-turn-helix domain-containing protein [Casimicrobiaceae bacterium]
MGCGKRDCPWAEARSRFTGLFQRLAIDVLLAADVTGATRILRLSWDEAWHLMERAVVRSRQTKSAQVPTRIGVDEKAAAKGHRYLTLVCDLTQATVEYIADERKQASVHPLRKLDGPVLDTFGEPLGWRKNVWTFLRSLYNTFIV